MPVICPWTGCRRQCAIRRAAPPHVILSVASARAATGAYDSSAYRYTDKPAPVAARTRLVAVYVDQDFEPVERDRIVAALRQWNYVLNGFVRFRATLLAEDPSDRELENIRRAGGWIIAKVDHHHRAARAPAALALTVGDLGGPGGGFVYVIADRFRTADLTAVMASIARAQSLESARTVASQAQSREQLQRFLNYGAGYQAQTVQMFH